jgi:enediyne polyketide synthase
VIHAVQACIPLRRLVPVRVDRLTIAGDLSGGCQVEAVERAQLDATYVYDLNLRDAAGRLIERWEGLHLRDIGPIAYRGGLPAMLLEPWLEREWQRADAAMDLRLVRLPRSRWLRHRRRSRAPLSCARPWRRTRRAGCCVGDAQRRLTVGIVANVPVGCDLEMRPPPNRWRVELLPVLPMPPCEA